VVSARPKANSLYPGGSQWDRPGKGRNRDIMAFCTDALLSFDCLPFPAVAGNEGPLLSARDVPPGSLQDLRRYFAAFFSRRCLNLPAPCTRGPGLRSCGRKAPSAPCNRLGQVRCTPMLQFLRTVRRQHIFISPPPFSGHFLLFKCLCLCVPAIQPPGKHRPK
jgi:hypothetical protein